MSTHVVMEQPGRADHTVLVPDRFVFTALIAPVIWLAWHRLWVEAMVALAVALGLGALSNLFDAPIALLGLLVGLYVALEGASLRIAALERRSYRQVGVIEANGREDAELRYLHDWRRRREQPAVAVARPAPVTPAGGLDAPMFGLIDVAGQR